MRRYNILAKSDGEKRLQDWKADHEELNLILPPCGTRGSILAGMLKAGQEYLNWHSRRKEKSSPSDRNDPPHALASSSSVFNKVIAGSAGAFMAPYYLTGDIERLAVCHHLLACRDFMNWFQIPPMKLDFVFDVMTRYMPFDVNAVIDPNAPTKLEIVATVMPDRTPVKLTNFQNRDELFLAMRASAKLPLNGLKPVVIDGRHMIDGGFSDHSCLRWPSQDTNGGMYILFSSRPEELGRLDFRSRMLDFAKTHMLDFIPHYPSSTQYVGEIKEAENLAKKMIKEGRLLVVYPSKYFSSAENDPATLERGTEDGICAFFRCMVNKDKIPDIDSYETPLPWQTENKVSLRRLTL